MALAQGTFDVQLTPQDGADAAIGRYTMAKTFHGELQATSTGQMLGAGDPKKGSAGYVAIEHVIGDLAGRHGSFVLQHSGTMADGALISSIAVIPASGTEDLSGLRGTMQITQEAGVHHYKFEYELPAAAGHRPTRHN